MSLIFCAGFEDRAKRAVGLLSEMRIRADTVLLLRYGNENPSHFDSIAANSLGLVLSSRDVVDITIPDWASAAKWLEERTRPDGLIVCDITGLSRLAMFGLLTLLANSGRKYCLIYTEAREYYPKLSSFGPLLRKSDPGSAFMQLTDYEEKEIVYSGNCQVEEIPGFEGIHLPNYPLLLIAFLTFKRSRVGAVLREYEANVRVLIKSLPVRSDLKWRDRAMEMINFDLIEDNRSAIRTVTTLDWRDTYKMLYALYIENENRYRYNFLLAPLGSKMQTVGAWLFAKNNPRVKVVTATPAKLFVDKYSDGFGDTFLIDDLPMDRKRQ